MSSEKEVYARIDEPKYTAIAIDEERCTGCNDCVEVCQVDVFLPAAELGDPPILAYPGECWHCGDCVDACPVQGAIDMIPMPKNRVQWKRKETGEDFQL